MTDRRRLAREAVPRVGRLGLIERGLAEVEAHAAIADGLPTPVAVAKEELIPPLVGRLAKAPKAAVNIFGLPNPYQQDFVYELLDLSQDACLFVKSSGNESVLV